ncbi:MAG: 4a-hydroxytetrahydrobiopterin dehydratase [Thermodesulfobacteriota bacterium]
MALLNETEIENYLKDLNDWSKDGNEITKTFKLKNFIESVGFVNKIAILAEKADHHPDILVQYSKVKINLATHSEGGITIKDINLATEIEDLN